MITEKEISAKIGKTIKSPIRFANLDDLNIDKKAFLNYFKPLFEQLEDDDYLVRENQITFLKSVFKSDIEAINAIHKDYFEGKLSQNVIQPWVDQLNAQQKEEFKLLSVITRQRNISSFTIDKNHNIERVQEKAFEQDVEDFRVWKRVFKQATKKCVENEFFNQLLKSVFDLVATIHPEVKKLKITSHFMRTLSYQKIKGENSPEGMHEDGAQYIISALVINRENITGAESQIFEKVEGTKPMIFNTTLQPGEFIFQADTGEEKTFGNDLWHYVTPIEPIDICKTGIRDIIGFDIEIVA